MFQHELALADELKALQNKTEVFPEELSNAENVARLVEGLL